MGCLCACAETEIELAVKNARQRQGRRNRRMWSPEETGYSTLHSPPLPYIYTPSLSRPDFKNSRLTGSWLIPIRTAPFSGHFRTSLVYRGGESRRQNAVSDCDSIPSNHQDSRGPVSLFRSLFSEPAASTPSFLVYSQTPSRGPAKISRRHHSSVP